MSVEQEGGYRSEEERQAAEGFNKKEAEDWRYVEVRDLSDPSARLGAEVFANGYKNMGVRFQRGDPFRRRCNEEAKKALELGQMSEEERTRFEADFYLGRMYTKIKKGPSEGQWFAPLNRGYGSEEKRGVEPIAHISPEAEEIVYDTLGVDKEAVKAAIEKVKSGESGYETVPISEGKLIEMKWAPGGRISLGAAEVRIAPYGPEQRLPGLPVRALSGREMGKP